MIKSKTKTIGFWQAPIMILIVIGLFSFTFIKESSTEDKIVMSIWTFFFISLSVLHLWVNSKLITINTFDTKITFTNLFTRRQTAYNLTEIDGYVDLMDRPFRGRPYRVIYLVKDEIFIQRISSFIYSNINEIEEGLKATKYLGQKKYSYSREFKILAGKKVLND